MRTSPFLRHSLFQSSRSAVSLHSAEDEEYQRSGSHELLFILYICLSVFWCPLSLSSFLISLWNVHYLLYVLSLVGSHNTLIPFVYGKDHGKRQNREQRCQVLPADLAVTLPKCDNTNKCVSTIMMLNTDTNTDTLLPDKIWLWREFSSAQWECS